MTQDVLDLTIAELVRTHPSSLELLLAHGFGVFSDPDRLASYGPVFKLRTLLKAQAINPDLFCRLLAEAEAGASNSPPSQPVTSPSVNLLALLPCPLKVPLEEAINSFLQTLSLPRRQELTFCIEGNANTQLDYAEYAEHFVALDEMPDIIITPGFNSFFHRPFVERFIKTSQFISVNHYAGDRHLAPLGVTDPDGDYTMFAMNLLVPVVNLARLGDAPIPSSWLDLLRPEYAGRIAIRGNRDGSFCETLLLALLKEHGEEGLEQLGRNVRYGWHPSQMVKACLSSSEDAPAISVMPLFFANNIRDRDRIRIIWPSDGALVSPVTMLVKREKLEPLADLLGFLTGPEVARICSGAFFPALHPEVDNGLPEAASFKWIGWDYVKNNDLKALISDANRIFRRGFEENRP